MESIVIVGSGLAGYSVAREVRKRDRAARLVVVTADDKVQAALRDLLAHRLWIKQHAAEATPAELDAACAAIEQSHRLMQAQLTRLDAIAAELAAAQSSARTVAPRGRTTTT